MFENEKSLIFIFTSINVCKNYKKFEKNNLKNVKFKA